MTRLLTLLLLLSLPALAQAVRPPPRPPPASATPPAHTPGFYPGTPAEPVYTPQGAGASHGSLPGVVAPPHAKVPPSPNKRILPATSEPGLWAADGTTKANIPPPKILDVEIPLPREARDEESRYIARNCADTMNFALLRIGRLDAAEALAVGPRGCLAARLYKACADATQKEYEAKFLPRGFDRRIEESIRVTRKAADDFVTKMCGASSSPSFDAIIDEAVREFHKLQNPPQYGN